MEVRLLKKLDELKEKRKITLEQHARYINFNLGIRELFGFLERQIIDEVTFAQYLPQVENLSPQVIKAALNNDHESLELLIETEIDAIVNKAFDMTKAKSLNQEIKKSFQILEESMFNIVQKKGRTKFLYVFTQTIIKNLNIQELYYFEQIFDGFSILYQSKSIREPTEEVKQCIDWFEQLKSNELMAIAENQTPYKGLQLKGMTHVLKSESTMCLFKINHDTAQFYKHSSENLNKLIKVMSQFNSSEQGSLSSLLIRCIILYLGCVKQILPTKVIKHIYPNQDPSQIKYHFTDQLQISVQDQEYLNVSISSSNAIKISFKGPQDQLTERAQLIMINLQGTLQKIERRVQLNNHYLQQASDKIFFRFDKFFRMVFCSQMVTSEQRDQFQLKQKLKFQDYVYQIFENNPIILFNIQQLVSQQIDQMLEITSDEQHYHLWHTLNSKLKSESLTIVLFYKRPNRNIKQLMAMFRLRVRLLNTLNRATSAFKSKQKILQNRTYLKSGLVEYLSERDLKQIMTVNESQIRRVDHRRDQTEHKMFSTKQTEKYERLLKQLAPFKPDQSCLIMDKAVIQEIDDIHFNILNVEQQEKRVQIVWNMINSTEFEIEIPMEQFCNFITFLKHKYNKNQNTFHNLLHGITVMHGCYLLQKNQKFNQILSEIERFSLVLSGLCHDLDHNATSNMFEVNSKSKLAIRYSDKSVLENHHISQTYKVLNHASSNILKNINTDQYNEIRLNVVNNILATDNKHHFQTLADLELRIKQSIDQDDIFGTNDKFILIDQQESRLILSGFLIHAADFYGAVQPFQVSNLWSTKVNQEFTAQYILEGKLGLPQTPFYKGLENPKNMAKNEIGFLKVIVKPLWEIIYKFSGEFEQLLKNLNETIQTYESVN